MYISCIPDSCTRRVHDAHPSKARAFALSFAASKKDTALVSPFQRILPSCPPFAIPPVGLPFHDSSQFFFELFVSNFTSPPSDPILFLFPRLSLCHSWSRRASERANVAVPRSLSSPRALSRSLTLSLTLSLSRSPSLLLPP